MSIEKWFLVVCNGCGRRDDPNDEAEQSVREVLKFLKEQGWKHENATAITDARDLCPDCAPKPKEPSTRTDDPRQQELF